MNKILKLPASLNRKGARYDLVKRGKKTLMYQQVYQGIVISYEVFRILIRKSTIIKGVFVPEKERFPHDEAFGHWATCLISKDKALQIFEEYEKS